LDAPRRVQDFFKGPRLPHECGVPVGLGTLHYAAAKNLGVRRRAALWSIRLTGRGGRVRSVHAF